MFNRSNVIQISRVSSISNELQNINDNNQTINNNENNYEINNANNNEIVNSNNLLNVFRNFLNLHMENSPNTFEDVNVSLDDEELNNLKTFTNDNLTKIDCCICLESSNVNDEISELPCNHKFHSNCIKNYLKSYNYKCPICRMAVGKTKYNI